jgi:membrane protein
VLLVISVGCLFIVFLALTIAINAVERWSETVAGGLGAAGFDRGSVLAVLVSPVLTFGVLLFLYRLVPRTRLRFRDLAVGAGAAAIASEAIRLGFSYYLATVARYDLLYGALGSVFAFLLVVYLQAIVLLLGAEIACVWTRSEFVPPELEPAVPLTKQARNAIRGLFVPSERD